MPRTSLMSVRILVSSSNINTQIKPVIGREAPLMLVNALDPFISFFWSLAVVSLEVVATSH